MRHIFQITKGDFMPVKIRLARHGRKRYAYYHIVVADSRAPRDGRYIERIGSYNPNTNPATIDLDFDKALDWLQKGAQPTDTARAILSYKGVLYKKHLLGGVKKGAFDEEEAENRFNEWVTEKEAKIQAKKDQLENEVQTAQEKQLEAERKIKEERAAAIAARNSKLTAEAEGENTETPDAETAEKHETPAEQPEAAAKEPEKTTEAVKPEAAVNVPEETTEAEEPEAAAEEPEKTEEPETEAPEVKNTEVAEKKKSADKDTEKAIKADAPDEKSSNPEIEAPPSEKKEEKP